MPTAKLSRRRFVAVGGGVLAAAAGVPALARSQAPGPRDPLVRSTWTALLGTGFVLPGGRVVLDAVDDVLAAKRLGIEDSPDAFSLTFHAAPGRVPDEGLYAFDHPSFGTVDLLLSPSGTGAAGQDFAVTINRLRPAQLTKSGQ